MQVAKYWRNNQLRYQMCGIEQDKVERKDDAKLDAVAIKVNDNSRVKQPKLTDLKADVA